MYQGLRGAHGPHLEGRDMGITQCVRRAVLENPQGRAIVFGARTRRWDEFAVRVARLAGGLRSIGVELGDRVAILALNSDRYLEAYAAVPWAGAVVVPLNTRWSAAENIYAINDSGAEVLLVDDAFTAVAASILAGTSTVRAVIHLGDAAAPAGMTPYEQLIENSAEVPDAKRTGEDLAGIFYTGGTTGFPKGVMLSHRSLLASASACTKSGFELTRDSVYLHAAPMFHLADFGGTIATLLVGGQHAVIPAFSAERVLAAVEEHRVTHILLVPTMIQALAAHPKVSTTDMTSLEIVMYGGSPMPEAVLRQAMQALHGRRFIQVYGQTELSPAATLLAPEYHTFEGPQAGKLGSAGRVLPYCELQVVDTADAEVRRGSVGQIRVRGPNTMLGYWNKPEETAATLRDGWVYTGDAGRLDEDGFLYVVDRVKDMIISGGENIFTVEVENACVKHPAVSQCAVIAVPDDNWGEAVHAIVILKDGEQVSCDELIAHCQRLIAGYKCPRSVEFRREPLPLSGAGKVLKRELRARYWEGRSRQVN
jgi:acyl-CoA synthetase (AMP-forming)/AMP-acid ligase II